jgi:putative ABC transport system permease protein
VRLTGIALGHLRRGKARALLVVVGLAIGVATAVALAGVTSALERRLGEEIDRYGANIVVAPSSDGLEVSYGGVSVSGVSYELERLRTDDLDRIRSIEYAERLAVVAPALVGGVDAGGRRAAVAGIDFGEATRLKSWWRVYGRIPSAPDEVLVGYQAARALGVIDASPGTGAARHAARPVSEAGGPEDRSQHAAHVDGGAPTVSIARERLTLGGEELRVAGVLDATGSADDRLVFADLSTAQRLLGRPGEISLVEVSALCVDCPVEAIVAQISDVLPNARVTAVQQAVKARSMTLARVGRFGAALAAVVLVVGGLLVFVTVTGSVAERRREIGVLRAVGYRRSHILRILGVEIALVSAIGGLLGWCLGVAAGSLAARYFAEGAVVPVSLDPTVGAIAVGGSVLLGALGALYPALAASRLDPTEALRNV